MIEVEAGENCRLRKSAAEILVALLRPYPLIFIGVRHADAGAINNDNPTAAQQFRVACSLKSFRSMLED